MRLRHKKVLKAAKGYYGARSRTFRSAQPAVIRAARYAYRDRKQKKRNFRALWIARINAGVRAHDLSYSRFINGLLHAGIPLNRKVLADIAIADQETFATLVMQAKAALAQKGDAPEAVVAQAVPVEVQEEDVVDAAAEPAEEEQAESVSMAEEVSVDVQEEDAVDVAEEAPVSVEEVAVEAQKEPVDVVVE